MNSLDSCTELSTENAEIPAEIEYPPISSWDELGVCDNLLRGIYTMGFESPSEIQRKAILPILKGRDVIAQAQSGTGKTATFSVSALHTVDLSRQQTQVLVMVPTHELALQITNVMTSLSTFMDGRRIYTMVGGTSVMDDMHELRNNPPHIVIGCTGRIYDMIRRRALNTEHIRLCILDEADEMLSDGFQAQVYNIFQSLNSSVQIALFSATMPEAMLHLTQKFMRNPVSIVMKPVELNLEGIKQYFMAIYDDRMKYDALKSLFSRITLAQTIIYANSVIRVNNLFESLRYDGYSVCAIHSSMTKSERKHIIDEFRNGTYKILISSNLTARGIDIQQVSMVINYDIPRSVETYLHRIGRSGRWGRKGTAINFVTKYDVVHMKNIETHYGVSVDELPDDHVFS